jgi:alkylation response protein AidB-like acyl-CoA dehydrogenase
MATSSNAELFEAIERIRPTLEATRSQSEAERHLAKPAFEALRDAGLFRVVVPRALGGYEADPVTLYRVIEELSKIDSAAGWSVGISAAWSGMGALCFSDEALAEFYPDTAVPFAGAFFPPGTLVPTDGGFIFNGRGAFASGCQHAKALMMNGLVSVDGQPVIDEATGQPDARLVLMPAADVKIHDTWNTFGMRGTGSHDIEAVDVFVPEHHVGRIGVPVSTAFTAPQYHVAFIGIHCETAVSLGVASAAIDYLVDLASHKTPTGTTTPLRDRASAQEKAARARALVDASRAYMYSSVEAAVDEFARTGQVSMEKRIAGQLSANFAAESCAKAVDLVWDAAGTSGVWLQGPLERYFRDIHTLAQHTSKSLARYESTGQVMFGLESDWVFFYI